MLSIIVGLEREFRQKTVGLRTNVLVCLGAFMFVSVSLNVIDDNTRIASQVVSGIGFLGAGAILREGNKVKGLNTAATLWCVASIGVLCSFGMIIEAFTGTVFILISNIILRLFARKIKNKKQCLINIKLPIIEEQTVKNLIVKLLNKYNINIDRFEKLYIDDNEINIKIYITSNNNLYYKEILKMTTTSCNINSIYIENSNINNEECED